MKQIEEIQYHILLNELLGLPKKIQHSMDLNPQIEELAKKYARQDSTFFIGRLTDYAAALEAALKLKEISYVHAEAYPAGELKHGSIALLEEGSLVAALCCNPLIMEKTMNNMVEVKARGARILAVTSPNNLQMVSLADDLILVPETDPLFLAVVEIVPLQLFAYYIAKERGCNIDQPKNLAKSVTVE